MKALAVCMMLATAALVVAAPTAAAGPPYECMDYYRETNLGPVTIIQRSSCDVEVCFEGEDGCGGILR